MYPGLSRWPYVITHVLVREAEGDLAPEVDMDGGGERGHRKQGFLMATSQRLNTHGSIT